MTEGKRIYLMKFRKHSSFETLEQVFDRLKEKLTGDELEHALSAYDHRKAEITTKRLFDKVPPSVWSLVYQ
ncbi:hemolysin expression modulating protein [Buttiauxella sp. BIGb0552]|uniref:Hha/YmoA family nucleoid-associated regulatory protein n=1 Tax=Buttiauxella sp. BIGb0552 TaxID=2485120 RepID=UPI001065EF29|nr:Hha/YmoA family nucleoid-associated regulatory protein [Buttiauxella sp. BIGb0552]TDX12037.1 hemolysin expression modulating protein [Buttiauxella sp. BIGb0552]